MSTTAPTDMTESELQRKCGDFVGREVLKCESMLVDDLLKEGKFQYEDISNSQEVNAEIDGVWEYFDTIEEAQEKLEELQEQLDTLEGEEGLEADIEKLEADIDSLERAIDEPDFKEIFEWWSVSNWLMEKLEQRGEPILHTDYGDYWGRCCTGQAIAMDSVIRDLVKEYWLRA